MSDLVLKTHATYLSSGPSDGLLRLKTKIIWNGDPGLKNNIYFNQKLILQSNCNSASFELIGSPLTPEILRRAADELDAAILESKENLLKIQNTEKKEVSS